MFVFNQIFSRRRGPTGVGPKSAQLGPSLAAFSLVVAIFAWPLWQWARFAAADELQSHLLCVPLVSLYLLALRRKAIQPGGPAPGWVLFWAGTAGLTGLAYCSGVALGYPWGGSDALTFGILAFVCGVLAVAVNAWGTLGVREVLFPLGFLFGMVPLPAVAVGFIQNVLQWTTAEVLTGLYKVTGLPAIRDGLAFQLPTITLEIAQECSGIHSTLVLIYTGLVGGYLFLRAPWHRVALVAVTIPLGIVRNAVRVWVLSWLCIHVGPQMIDSPVHHRGGPFFFALTVGVLGLLMVILRRRERRSAEGPAVRVLGTPREDRAA